MTQTKRCHIENNIGLSATYARDWRDKHDLLSIRMKFINISQVYFRHLTSCLYSTSFLQSIGFMAYNRFIFKVHEYFSTHLKHKYSSIRVVMRNVPVTIDSSWISFIVLIEISPTRVVSSWFFSLGQFFSTCPFSPFSYQVFLTPMLVLFFCISSLSSILP